MTTSVPRWLVFLPLLAVLLFWHTAYDIGLISSVLLPRPVVVAVSLMDEVLGARLWSDLLISLGRLAGGLIITVSLGTPLGLWLGQSRWARTMLLPYIDFLRTLSPLAWMPFVVMFAGVGSQAAVVLIVLACAPTMIVGATHAALSIAPRHYDIAQLHQLGAWERFAAITFRGSLRGLVATMRLTMAIGWIVLVAAEMVAGQDGLGYAIMDSRNGMRYDLVIVYMLTIGVVGTAMDRLCFHRQLTPQAVTA